MSCDADEYEGYVSFRRSGKTRMVARHFLKTVAAGGDVDAMGITISDPDAPEGIRMVIGVKAIELALQLAGADEPPGDWQMEMPLILSPLDPEPFTLRVFDNEYKPDDYAFTPRPRLRRRGQKQGIRKWDANRNPAPAHPTYCSKAKGTLWGIGAGTRKQT